MNATFGPPFGHFTSFGFFGPLGCAKVVTAAVRRKVATKIIKCNRAIADLMPWNFVLAS